MNPSAEVIPPDTNTFRQATRLDFLRQSGSTETSEWVPVPHRMNGTEIISLEINIPALRRALGLPPYPLFAADIFRLDEELSRTVTQDMPDIDHADNDE
jgi:hypothetical protein